MRGIDKALFPLGLVCHLIGMPLAEWVDVRWFYMVLAGEGIWLIYARRRKKGKIQNAEEHDGF